MSNLVFSFYLLNLACILLKLHSCRVDVLKEKLEKPNHWLKEFNGELTQWQ